MATFSERYGYTKVQDSVIRDCLPQEVINILCTLFDTLKEDARIDNQPYYNYEKLELDIWCFYLKRRKRDIYNTYGHQKDVITSYFEDDTIQWYEKLNLLEYILSYLNRVTRENNYKYDELFFAIIRYINHSFESCHYGYRIVNMLVTPITSQYEIDSVEQAITESKDNVKTHLEQAIESFANKETPDYRNSIKESITAVEVICRELTGENTLGTALTRLSAKGIEIHPILKNAYSKLYDYTNQKDTGIRHALMQQTDVYTPSYNEAYYMLVSCSAFINYLRGIVAK